MFRHLWPFGLIAAGLAFMGLGVLFARPAVAQVATTAPGALGSVPLQGTATATATPSCAAFAVVPSANPGSGDNVLNGVAVVAAGDIWAAGYVTSGTAYQALIQHWDGSAWSVVVSPDLGTDSRLNGVAAVASDDVWAVGSRCN